VVPALYAVHVALAGTAEDAAVDLDQTVEGLEPALNPLVAVTAVALGAAGEFLYFVTVALRDGRRVARLAAADDGKAHGKSPRTKRQVTFPNLLT
jgi:hypothetical protein